MHRKKIKGTVPVKCSMCKEKKAYHTVHGNSYGGRTMCEECYKIQQKIEQDKLPDDDHETEAEYQIGRMLDRF